MNSPMPVKNRRVLIIDDNAAIHGDFRKILSTAPAGEATMAAREAELFGVDPKAIADRQFEVDSAYQGAEGAALVQRARAAGRPYALVFVDVRMPPGWDGVETTKNIWAVDPEVQIVFCTAYSDYDWDELFRTLGHRDGLLILKKPFDTVEALQMAHALTEKWALHQESKRKLAELESRVGEHTRELQRQQTELRVLFDYLPAMIVFKDTENRLVRVNRRLAEAIGKSIAAVEGKCTTEIFPRDAAKFYADDLEVIRSGVPKLGIIEMFLNREDQEVWVQTDKVPVLDELGKVVGLVVMAQDITERRRTEESLRLLGSAVAQSKEAITITDAELDAPGPRIVFVNAAFTQLTGYTAAEVLGKTPRILQGPRTDKTVLARLRKNLERGEGYEGEAINYRKDGSEFDLEWQVAPLRDARGVITHFVATQRDVTRRKRLEAQLVQAQKMETVGKLAGGIAHEFNSIMTVIIGQSELLLSDLPAGAGLREHAVEIRKAADRAASLTRQLLAYGRKQILQPESLDLNEVLASMAGVICHLSSASTDVRILPNRATKSVRADLGQLEQVIVNIVMNAADAMPRGGKLTLETAPATLDQNYVSQFPELKAGDYVMLAITDTGVGMREEVRARVFEPFYTTKGVGKGTGLGLATCHGIIKQSGGHIAVYSELGRGTTFKIYLPAVTSQPAADPRPPESADLPQGTETVLLVEDDPALRAMATTLLGRLGYTVITAGNGVEALALLQDAATGRVDLLFTDVVMPQMSGTELADRLRAGDSATRILFTSAYTEGAIGHQGVLHPGVELLPKPFTPSALAQKVRAVLDQPKVPPRDATQGTFGFPTNS